MISVERDILGDWTLEQDGDCICTCVEEWTRDRAIDTFAANYPHLSGVLDTLRDAPRQPKARSSAIGRTSSGREVRRGSGARFRELFGEGKTNAEALKIVRAEFPDSKATLSDAAWNRGR